MKILLTNHDLDRREGTHSYLETVAPELRRLEHEIVLFAPRLGRVADSLRGRGFEVHDRPGDVPADIDVIHGQHVAAVGAVRERLPRTPLVFASHSWFVPWEQPLVDLGARAFLAFNDLTAERLRAHVAAHGLEVHRLTQPVTLSFADGARFAPRARARRAVAVSRRLGSVGDALAAEFARRGIAFTRVGAPGAESDDPRPEILASDIVIGMGRSALEAMAAGRPTLVLDQSTVGGWVTADSYPGLESDGFTGVRSGAESSLVGLLDGYSPEHGVAARRAVVRHHDAARHATRLVEVYRSVLDESPGGDRRPDSAVLLAGESHYWESRAIAAEWETALVRRELDEVRRSIARWRRLPPARAVLALRRLILRRRGG